jgi:hypothetical protein
MTLHRIEATLSQALSAFDGTDDGDHDQRSIRSGRYIPVLDRIHPADPLPSLC